MLLKQEIDQLNAALAQQVPPQVLSSLAEAIRQLDGSGIARSSVQVGEHAPEFALPNASGVTIKLADLLQEGPVVLSFYRGIWCPYCNLELAALQRVLPQIRELGAQLVAVSPQTPEPTQQTVAKHGLAFQVLCDEGNRVAESYGLSFLLPESVRPVYAALGVDLPGFNGDDTFKLPMAATYVIARDGKVSHAFVNADYTQRLEPAEIVAALERLKRS